MWWNDIQYIFNICDHKIYIICIYMLFYLNTNCIRNIFIFFSSNVDTPIWTGILFGSGIVDWIKMMAQYITLPTYFMDHEINNIITLYVLCLSNVTKSFIEKYFRLFWTYKGKVFLYKIMIIYVIVENVKCLYYIFYISTHHFNTFN